MKKIINTVTKTITFTFDGGLPDVVLDVAHVRTANQTHAMLHGFAARIGDNAAIQKSAENGYTVTEAMRRYAVIELVGHYTSGSEDWSPRAKAAPKTKQNPTIAAIAVKLGKTYEQAEAYIAERMLAELEG